MSTMELKERIHEGLLRLIEQQSGSAQQWVAWCANAARLKSLLGQDDGTLRVPHIVWHYLDDADIRMRDWRYAEAQASGLRDAIAEWLKLPG